MINSLFFTYSVRLFGLEKVILVNLFTFGFGRDILGLP